MGAFSLLYEEKDGGCGHGFLRSSDGTASAFAGKHYSLAVFSICDYTKLATDLAKQSEFSASRVNTFTKEVDGVQRLMLQSKTSYNSPSRSQLLVWFQSNDEKGGFNFSSISAMPVMIRSKWAFSTGRCVAS